MIWGLARPYASSGACPGSDGGTNKVLLADSIMPQL